MDNLDDSENNAKVSDSAYSNSCSNSQSRRSHSSKSTHSGSHSSGSSGYGGKPSTSGSSNAPDQTTKKEKESKKKKQPQVEAKVVEEPMVVEIRPPEPVPVFHEPKQVTKDVVDTPTPVLSIPEKVTENMDISTQIEINSVKDEVIASTLQGVNAAMDYVASRPNTSYSSDGFSCVISMHDGVVMYTTQSLTATLGFPKDMWIGRSFIDFVHPKDRNTFASQITNGLAVPKIVNGTQEKAQSSGNSASTMVCRIRRYRGLHSGYSIKDRVVTFMPFLLKFTFKNVNDEEGNFIYLVIQATPFYSAFRLPNEVVTKPVPFVIRHAANGNIEYIDPESVSYLGYLPQDLQDKDALQLYHPEDLPYLKQIYETIVKEGKVPRSKPYRMLTQNGEYLKLETEWSSFINPWSMKLEFVIGKHHILEGPVNPDVFQSQEPDKNSKTTDEEKNKAQGDRDTIIRIMNEVLTKPAEVAKQQMSKRCQDLALFMESLMEEPTKTDEELRLDIQDPDHSYYERDSVMLGGISPHHDHNDSKSSTETPLSYNQLNYNDNLQRYFDSHQQNSNEDNAAVPFGNVLHEENVKEPTPGTSKTLSPGAQLSGDTNEISSSASSGMMYVGSSPAPSGDYQPPRLTESLLNKHNAEMEKELLKMHRETRSGSKGDREKASNETRQKTKEHLKRCNASFQPTLAGAPSTTMEAQGIQPQGVKRSSKQIEAEGGAHKHHCPSARQSRRKQTTSAAPVQPSSTITTTAAASPWPAANPVNNMNAFMLGVAIPPQVSLMSPLPPMSGVFPMYYAPTAAPTPSTSQTINSVPSTSGTQYQAPAVPCMMYGQPMYGSHFVYSPINQPVTYPIQQTLMAQSMYSNTLNPLGLASSNYLEDDDGYSYTPSYQACKSSFPMRPNKLAAARREKKRAESQATTDQGSGDSSTNALNREEGALNKEPANRKKEIFPNAVQSTSNSLSPKSTEAVPDTSASRDDKSKTIGNSDGTVDRTDGESSYSSFYSSFFKTESGSAEDSGDLKKGKANIKGGKETAVQLQEAQQTKKIIRKKMEPPWMEQVCVTSELVYKYQILTKTIDEVLQSDKEKMTALEQPSLVNEQLGQLYLDLQLEGVAARLTLEEGITSSSSSGEETTNSALSGGRKREYSKLVMIYEEDAPLPPPTEPGPSSPPTS